MVRLKSLCYVNAKLENFLQFSKDFLQKMFIFLAFLLISIKIFIWGYFQAYRLS